VSDALSLTRAELLKLGRRRGLMGLCAAFSVGAIALMFGVLELRHLADRSTYGAAGGGITFDHAIEFLGFLAVVLGTMLGASCGAADAEAGTLGDLVVTGRSRLSLYASRYPAALAATTAFLLAAGTLAAACAAGFGGDGALPLGHIVGQVAAILVAGLVSAALGLAVAAVVGSRGSVIGSLIVLQLIISQLLIKIDFLGPVRELLPLSAFLRLAGNGDLAFKMSLATAIVVLAAWSVASAAAGAWWFRRSEI
jgi:ABC-type transport system involved in multi-copper enzyme maturation permease subunit